MSSKNIKVEKIDVTPIELQDLEMVERKGLGHPDTLTDAAVEETSRALCNYYIEHFGRPLHHNVDKGSLAGGRSSATFGGGEVIEPIYIQVIGRASSEVEKEGKTETVPIGTLCFKAIREHASEIFRFLDPNAHLQLDHKIRPGSVDLVGLFDAAEDVPLANDTSFGVSFAPFSETERIAYDLEWYLNSPDLKKKLPETGEDIKIMALRLDDKIHLTIAVAIISSLCPDLDHYLSVKEQIRDIALDFSSKITEREALADVNTADKPDKGIVYLTVTGTSAEHGDDGQVGRGNRVNGLITPNRPMSLEATCGKNPISHVGKIYNVLARLIADQIIEEVPQVDETYVRVLSQIGRPINDPLVASAQLVVGEGVLTNVIKNDVAAIIEDRVDRVTELTDMILQKRVALY